jgi:hypothetical protein
MQAIQPLDYSFFKPLKEYFRNEARHWMLLHNDMKTTRIQADMLTGRDWKKYAISGNRNC